MDDHEKQQDAEAVERANAILYAHWLHCHCRPYWDTSSWDQERGQRMAEKEYERVKD